MTIDHRSFLELAAASVDFELTASEQVGLDDHVRTCVACRRRIARLRGDAREIAALPPFVLDSVDARRIRASLGRRSHTPLGTLRLVAIAAILALAAAGAVAVGAELLRQADRDLARLRAIEADQSTDPSLPPATRAGQFSPGAVVDVVVTGLRVRTLPTVDNATSAKFEPLLGSGSKVRIIQGPVSADGYEWYLIEAIGSPQRGWVAAGDHDGTPWIEDPVTRSDAPPAMSVDELALVEGLRPDAARNCARRESALPARALVGVECRLRTALVARVGAYRYASAADAALTYLERLAGAGVKPLSGDCSAGTSGERAWGSPDQGDSPGQVVFASTGPWSPGRIGCFLDDNGTANVRLTCGSVAIGVLGQDARLKTLWAWAWQPRPAGSGDEAPGICRGF
ncbi:MAG TPA: hypothetical protein VFK35_01580 [Candidatus Limnocylindrales bacterium]|nr:hypothetical protein [Candidatus Limnocylindrales bacterium]